MLIFLYIYFGISFVSLCLMAYGIKHAEEVPQDIDIYDL